MKTGISLMMLFVIIRRLIYLSLATLDRIMGKANPIIIFCYHSISNDNWRFSVDINEFKKQVELLLKNYQPISLSELYGYINGGKELKRPSFLITFDDGYQDILKTKSFLKSKGITPAVFVLGTSENKINRESLGTNRNLLSQKDIHDLRNSGWEIGYHGMTHTPLTHLNGNLEEEISSSYKYFSYPHGKYSGRIISSLKRKGYKLALTMDDSIISKKTNVYTIPKIGVDKTHSFSEFRTLASPSVVKFRSTIKRSFLGRYL